MKKQVNNFMGFGEPSNYPTIFNKQMVSNEYTIHFSQEFEHPCYYDEVVSLLLSADEIDSVIFVINNFGGRVDALNSILNALAVTKATVTGFLVGQGCSCASVLFLSCHNWMVGDNTTLMIHEQSFFVGGKASETKKQHEHYQIQNDRFIREVYKDFLTPEEIESCLRGEDYYFEDFEIRERLQYREQKRMEQAQEEVAQQMKEFEETQFDYSELPLEALEEELLMYKEDMKKINKAIADKKKESEAVASPKAVAKVKKPSRVSKEVSNN